MTSEVRWETPAPWPERTPLPYRPDCGSINRQSVDGAEAPPVGGVSEGSGWPVMEHEPGEDFFLVLCERLFALSLEQAALLTQATEARNKGDQDTLDETAEAIEANTVERRLVLWRLYEMTDFAKR